MFSCKFAPYFLDTFSKEQLCRAASEFFFSLAPKKVLYEKSPDGDSIFAFWKVFLVWHNLILKMLLSIYAWLSMAL